MWRSPIVAPCPSQGVAPAFCMLCRYGLEPDTTSSSLYGGSARPAGRRARRKAGTMRKSGTILAIALAGILSACASGPAPVDVTRFHLGRADAPLERGRSEEHTSELQSLMRLSYAVFCLKKNNHTSNQLTPQDLTQNLARR